MLPVFYDVGLMLFSAAGGPAATRRGVTGAAPPGAAPPSHARASASFKTGWHRPVDTAPMTERTFTPALGRCAPTPVYAPVAALTRERLWRALRALHVAPQPGDVIVDVCYGTGSPALLLKHAEPRARITGVDPGHTALTTTRRKAGAAGVTRERRVGTGAVLIDQRIRLRPCRAPPLTGPLPDGAARAAETTGRAPASRASAG